MRKSKQSSEEYSDEEAARRRDEITKALIKMPPKLHAPSKAKKRKNKPSRAKQQS
jgi:hypothetical protein